MCLQFLTPFVETKKPIKMEELVSIITPSFNSENFISETIQSVLKQNYTNWEMIIVDDFRQIKQSRLLKNWHQKTRESNFLNLIKIVGLESQEILV